MDAKKQTFILCPFKDDDVSQDPNKSESSNIEEEDDQGNMIRKTYKETASSEFFTVDKKMKQTAILSVRSSQQDSEEEKQKQPKRPLAPVFLKKDTTKDESFMLRQKMDLMKRRVMA